MQKKYPHLLALILGVITVLLYWPGLGGTFFYDDYSNLNALSSIANLHQFIEFVFSGNAGPLGRPIALLTFGLQSAYWPGGGAILLGTNVAIHACNAILVFYLCRQLRLLTHNTCEASRSDNEFALIAAAFWALSPILASSSLILVQRMTGLSALFVLLGLLGYLRCYSHFKNHPRQQLLVQALILGAATVLSALSKENGVLLPSLAFAIEIALLNNTVVVQKYRNIRLAVLGLSVAVFLVYLSPLARPWFEINEYRGFSSWQRVQGELVILWRYIYLTLFPKIAYFGPFQDQVDLGYSVEAIGLSAFAWLLITGVAFGLRKRNPWPWFAVLWFLIGHMIESGPLLLEPYFEHRNYIPLLGIATLIAHASSVAIKHWGNLARLAIYGYLTILAAILLTLTSLWGKPLEAANFWVETNPGSIRAVVHQVNLSMSSDSTALAENNMNTIQINRMMVAIKLLDKTTQWCKDCLSIYMQTLAYSCIIEEPDKTRVRLAKIDELLAQPKISIDITSVDGTAALGSLVVNQRCPAVQYTDIEKILNAMLAHEKQATSPGLVARIYYQLATLAYAEQRYDEVEKIISTADKKWPDAQPVIEFRIEYYLQHSSRIAAINYIREKMAQHQRNEVHLPRSYLIDLERRLQELEKNEN